MIFRNDPLVPLWTTTLGRELHRTTLGQERAFDKPLHIARTRSPAGIGWGNSCKLQNGNSGGLTDG